MTNENTSDPLQHTSNVKKEFRALIDHLCQDISKIEDLSAKALFEVSAEVLIGLGKAFTDYEQKNEAAWKN
jgi:hypothetical protein